MVKLKKGNYITFIKSSHGRKEKITRVTKCDTPEIKTKCDDEIEREYSVKYIELQIDKGDILYTTN